MSPAHFRSLLNHFYQAAAQAVDKQLGVVDKFLGDGVLALFIPGFGGPDHAHQAIQAGTAILRVTGNASGEEHPWLPIGAGIHTGIAFVGSIGTAETFDFTALGDTVNAAARLGSIAKRGNCWCRCRPPKRLALTSGVGAAPPKPQRSVPTLRRSCNSTPVGLRLSRRDPEENHPRARPWPR